MKLVAVSQRIDIYPGRDEMRDALDQRLIEFLLAAGFLPVPVPNNLLSISSKPYAFFEWLSTTAPSAFVLSGGNDIGSYLLRDQTETHLLNYAEQLLLPVLGICRGMQMMGMRAGAKLRKVTGHVKTRHSVSGIINREINSFHNFVIDACPTGFSVLAKSGDGEIEAVKHQSLAWEGWMWHPERETSFAADDVERLRTLFETKCTNRMA